MSPSTKKALFACLFFAAVGIFGWFQVADSGGSLPLSAYYTVLLINTFFSIRTFSAITPDNFIQMLFDAVLAGAYVALAFSFGSVALFSFVSSALFLMAAVKYVHLQRLVPPHAGLLRRKIRVNVLGALLSLAALAAAVSGLPLPVAWILCVVFTLASAYLLFIDPLYRLHD